MPKLAMRLCLRRLVSEVAKRKEPKASFDECAKRLRSRMRGDRMFYGEDEGVPIESEVANQLSYLVKDNHIIIDGYKNGILSIAMDEDLIFDIADEMSAIIETYKKN